MTRWEKYLRQIYYDPKHPASYSSPGKLYRAVITAGKYDISKAQIKKWLQSQETYTLHRAIRRKFKRNKVIAPMMNYQWEIDLADLKHHASENSGYKYFLAAIDVMSRYAYTRKLKTKNSSEVLEAFKSILDESGNHPQKVRSDKATEFTNQHFQKFLKSENIDHFVTQNEVKANYCERLLKTLKNKIARYMSKKQSHRWVDILPAITKSYNETYHRSINKSPAKVSKKDEIALWRLQHEPKPLIKKQKTSNPKSRYKPLYKFKLGDTVRISHLRRAFQREYDQRWTDETFKVVDRFIKGSIPHYILKDQLNEMISGSFYNDEIEKVYEDASTVYRIESVLRTRVRKGKSESLVSWKGWPSKFQSWIPSKDIKRYK